MKQMYLRIVLFLAFEGKVVTITGAEIEEELRYCVIVRVCVCVPKGVSICV